MIVRTYSNAGVVDLFAGAISREIVRFNDGMGHALVDTTLNPGAGGPTAVAYGGRFAAEAHYCLSGAGSARCAGRDVALSPGVLVAAAAAGELTIESSGGMRLCSVFGLEAETEGFVARSLDEVLGTPRDVDWGNGRSRRLLIRDDGMGFALCVTTGNPGSDSPLHYRRHLESCYYISGSGRYVWNGSSHPIEAADGQSTAFIMDRNDPHRMVIDDASICLSVFSPAIEGHERHSFSGAAASSY